MVPVGREFGGPDFERLSVLDIYSRGAITGEDAMHQLGVARSELAQMQERDGLSPLWVPDTLRTKADAGQDIQSVAVKGFRLDVSLRRRLAHLPARQISQLTLEAVAHAVAANRRELHQQDFPRWLFEGDATAKSSVNPTYIP